MRLTVLTYNTLFAGRDGSSSERLDAQIALLNDVRPDVFLMQEAKGFDANGCAWLYEMEHRIGMRGFLALAPRTGQHLAIFLRDPLRPIAFGSDGANFHHGLATLTVEVPGIQQSITFVSAHLCPNGPEIRRREAAYLAVQAAPERLMLIAGDFNSASPHDPEPVGFDVLPAQHRTRYLADDLKSVDHGVLAKLETAGWVDLGNLLDTKKVPTVPTKGYVDAEFAAMRCDYMLASSSLAKLARKYEVLRNESTDAASDHYPVFAHFELA